LIRPTIAVRIAPAIAAGELANERADID